MTGIELATLFCRTIWCHRRIPCSNCNIQASKIDAEISQGSAAERERCGKLCLGFADHTLAPSADFAQGAEWAALDIRSRIMGGAGLRHVDYLADPAAREAEVDGGLIGERHGDFVAFLSPAQPAFHLRGLRKSGAVCRGLFAEDGRSRDLLRKDGRP